MNNIEQKTAKTYLTAHGKKKKWMKVVTALACVVVFFTTYALIMPAVTKTADVFCGFDEHVHTDACYEQVLKCVLEENDEHKHSAECYESDRENPVCGKEEHTHVLQCYSDPQAGVESASAWDQMVGNVEFTGNWSEDLVKVAKLQLGYSERKDNYLVAEDGETKFGYTRFGEYSGAPYDDWNVPFVSFCLHYAGLDAAELPIEGAADTKALTEALAEDERGLLHYYGSGEPEEGDLIFFGSVSEENGREYTGAGIVTEIVKDGSGKLETIRVIEGDYEDEVSLVSYAADSENILAFARLPENPDYVAPETVVADNTADENATAAENVTITDNQTEEGPIAAEIDDNSTIAEDNRTDIVNQTEELIGETNITEENTTTAENETQAAEENTTEDNTAAEVTEPEKKTPAKRPVMKSGLKSTPPDYGTPITYDACTIGTVSPSVSDQSGVTSFTVSGVQSDYDKATVTLYRSTNGGSTWTSVTSSKDVKKGNTYSLTDSSTSSATFDYKWKIEIKKDDKNISSDTFDLPGILEAAAPGFVGFANTSYCEDFGGSHIPEIPVELVAAYLIYTSLPETTLSSSYSGDDMILSVSCADPDAAQYQWQYQDTDGTWKALPGASGASVNASEIAVLNDGGRNVRCKVRDAGGNVISVSNTLFVNPQQKAYDEAIAVINSELGLNNYKLMSVADTAQLNDYDDLSIGGDRFMNDFYYGAVARDSKVPFNNGQEYANYLAKTYIENGGNDAATHDAALEKVRAEFDKYLFDIYDPSGSTGTIGNVSGGTYLVGENTYGDEGYEWPKESMSSFHNTIEFTPEVKPIDYDKIDGGIDYGKFMDTMDKKATAHESDSATGDDRKFDIQLSSQTQPVMNSPVALIVQIQTSWQMFDIAHADYTKADAGNGTAKDSAAKNITEMATLYDIKHALLRLADYMENEYPGNNLVLGISETKHGGSTSIFGSTTMSVETTDNKGRTQKKDVPLYVSNDPAVLRTALYGYDIFGNCEHVHYLTDTLEATVNSLEDNLSTFTDPEGNKIEYDDITKIGLIFGGPTENSNGTDGYGCVLPWSTFASNDFNAVYGIQTVSDEHAEPRDSAALISWMENASNNGTPFKDGKGSGFTEKFECTTEDAIYDALLQIIEDSINANQIKVTSTDSYVDDVTFSDTISRDFEVSKTDDICADVRDENSKLVYSSHYNPSTGKVTFITYENGVAASSVELPADVSVNNGKTVVSYTAPVPGTTPDGTHQELIIEEKADGSTDITMNYGRVFGGLKPDLKIVIEAKDTLIGGNDIHTNEGTPEVEYTPPKGGDPVVIPTDDDPTANVPLDFEVIDGDTVTVMAGDDVDLASLGIERMVEDVLKKICSSNQVNGTVTFGWKVSDGTALPVDLVIDVENGVPSIQLLDGSGEVNADAVKDAFAAIYNAAEAGSYVGQLSVTFTPDKTTGSSVTNIPAATKTGKVWINAKDTEKDVSVAKEWVPEVPADITEINFVIKRDDGKYVTFSSGTYGVADDISDATRFPVTGADNWVTTVEDLPGLYTDPLSGEILEYEYTVEEDITEELEDYTASYSQKTVVDKSVTFKVSFELNKDKEIKDGDNVYYCITYSIDGGEQQQYISPSKLVVGKNKGVQTIDVPFSGDVSVESTLTSFTFELGTVKEQDVMGFAADNASTGKISSQSGSYNSSTNKLAVTVGLANKQEIKNMFYRVNYTVNGEPFEYVSNDKITINKGGSTTLNVSLPSSVSSGDTVAFTSVEFGDMQPTGEKEKVFTKDAGKTAFVKSSSATFKVKADVLDCLLIRNSKAIDPVPEDPDPETNEKIRLHKTASPHKDDSGNVLENEFDVTLSIDLTADLLAEYLKTADIQGATSNGYKDFPLGGYSSSDLGTGIGVSMNSDQLYGNKTDATIKDPDGNMIYTGKISWSQANNVTAYLRLKTDPGVIIMGTSLKTSVPDVVKLSSTAYEKLMQDVNAFAVQRVVDEMGPYVEFVDGSISGDIITGDSSKVTSYNPSTRTITWYPKFKDNPQVTVEPGDNRARPPIPESKWYIGISELTYRVRLSTEKEGFNSAIGALDGSDPTKLFDTNDHATAYYFETLQKDFPVPQVLGWLYNLQIIKTNSKTGLPVAGAVFEITGTNAADGSSPITAFNKTSDERVTVDDSGVKHYYVTTDENGVAKFTDLVAMDEKFNGVFTITEVQPPAGYMPVADPVVMSISNYTTHPELFVIDGPNMRYAPNPDVSVLNQPNPRFIFCKKVLGSDEALEGAVFELYRTDADGNREDTPMFTFTSGPDGKLDTPADFNLGLDENGNIGYYELVEAKAPDGYDVLTGPIKITVSRTGVLVTGPQTVMEKTIDTDKDIYSVTIRDSYGYELPHTGGPGTKLLYSLGALLVASTMIYGYILKRKRERRCK